ncbi:LytR/AlgR family response regulator transcription factor [Aquiflexum gelatinilyticum]|uniref:LytTR family transcriptional regulator n=1 Tax=Aquiflexum gelatinilyticum TaxID=2961943 RepID=A0A9X2P9L6_9BACT|nr:LytTR family DNA-binding domain-containing protein [Aquiflexum gelatinilyticum]MCR9014635.1 LytTR family transcriptional regulator [Aquiflexum gelatinilyticum]
MERIKNMMISKIAIPILNGFEILNIYEIIRCEANGNYCKIISPNIHDAKQTEVRIVSRNLKEICSYFSKKGFIRIHHSHLINPIYIKKILKSEGGTIEMVDGIKIRITQNKETILNEIFDNVPKI